MRPTTLIGFALLSLSAAACSAGDSGPDADEGSVNCALETTADQFTVGLEKAGTTGKLDFQLMSATPAPPERGDNAWILQVSALASGVTGAPLAGATIDVTSFMPKHMHDSPKTVEVQAMPTMGQYKLSPVFLWMPGLWETTIQVTTPSNGTDSAIYRFCIPG